MRRWLLAMVMVGCGRTAVLDFSMPATVTDAGTRDAGARDAGPGDAGPRDAGRADAGLRDGGRTDAGAPDSGPEDGGLDAGRPELGLAQTDVIYVHESNQLYTYSPATGVFARLTGLSCGAATDMAIDRNGRAFLVSGSTLVRVNLVTGTCTPVARVPETLVALTFLPAGLLDQLNESLVGYGETAYWEFDPTDGFASRLGTSALSGGLVPSGDLSALSDGGTYLTVRDRGWLFQRPDELVRIDPLTGAVLEQLGPLGVVDVWGLATFDEQLFGFSEQGRVVQFSLEDGGVRTAALSVPGAATRRFWGAAARPGARSTLDAGP